jgi:hypothetical protein
MYNIYIKVIYIFIYNILKMKKKTKDNYIRPIFTHTDKLSKEEISDLLDDYVEISISDIDDIKLGTHLRYIIINDDNVYKFRLGGNLINKKGFPIYIILNNGKMSWSVQLNKNIKIFKRISIYDIKKIYINQIEELNKQINYRDKHIENLNDKILKLSKNSQFN